MSKTIRRLCDIKPGDTELGFELSPYGGWLGCEKGGYSNGEPTPARVGRKEGMCFTGWREGLSVYSGRKFRGYMALNPFILQILLRAYYVSDT